MWIMLATGPCCLVRDQEGQLGESREYWLGRSESGPHDIRSSDGGSPRLCLLWNTSVVPPTTRFELCTDTYRH
jgi:hypothetical protein